VPLQGSVTFTENGLVLQGPGCPSPAPVSAFGQASCTTTSLPAGADTILAVYSNDSNYTGSSGYLSANNQVVPQTVQDFSLVISSTPPVVVSQGYTSSSDLFTSQTISVVPISIQGFATANTPTAAPLNLACSVTAVFSPVPTPTLPLCTPSTATLAVSGTGAQGAVPIVVDATKASAGIYSVQETGTDPTTGLAHSASFQVTVESASDPVTVVSGATTGNGGNLSFMLPIMGTFVVLQTASVWVGIWTPLDKRLIQRRLMALGIRPEQFVAGWYVGLSNSAITSSVKRFGGIEEDIGMLWFTPAQLIYYGDSQQFSLTRQQLMDVERRADSKSVTMLSGTRHVILHVLMPDGNTSQIRLHNENVWTMGGKKRVAEELGNRIDAWRTEATTA